MKRSTAAHVPWETLMALRLAIRPAAALVLVLMLGAGAEAGEQQLAQNLKRLSLEELMEIEVTLVTREAQPVGSAAAAVSVITRDDIRRSGVTTVPDAVALADGVHVARFNNGTWAITARGFNANTADKLLVMVDGRNEFTPLFAGVFWNTIDYILEDIERIEVIRGPGATLWGANAVNGVVNIVTRSATETRGTLVSLVSGSEDPAIGEVRYGGGSEAFSYRVYGKFAQRDAQRFSTGLSAEDTRRRGQAGLRLDGRRGGDRWTVKTDLFHSRDEFPDRRDGEWTGIAVHGRFSRQLPSGDSLQLQSYYRREYRNIERQLTHHLDTIDVDFQHALKRSRHHFIWGAAARSNDDATAGSAVVHFEPQNRNYPMFSAFAQNEFTLRADSVFLTAGLKVEHNAFSGADWQPNLRARWVLRSNQVLWGSVARAARRPTRFDDDIVVTAPNGLALIRGSDDFQSEVMTGVELGYRTRPLPVLSVDITGFFQDYDRLRSQEAPPAGVIPVTVGNTLTGRSRGVELAAILQPVSRWRIRFSYTGLSTDIGRSGSSRDVSGGVNEANDPSYFLTLRSAVDLPRRIEVDAWLRRVDALPNPAVPAYTELNARIGWRPREALELAIVGQDLLHAHHPEFGTSVPRRTEFERSLRAQLTVRLP